jgi:hypothetical protein
MNNTTKLDNTQVQYEAPEEPDIKEEERTMSKLELISIDRHEDNSFIVNRTADPVNEDLSIESGRIGLINNPTIKNEVKKPKEKKGLGRWDKDYK